MPNIAAHDLEALILVFVLGAGQQADRVTALPQGFCGGKADKAAAAGDENVHKCILPPSPK